MYVQNFSIQNFSIQNFSTHFAPISPPFFTFRGEGFFSNPIIILLQTNQSAINQLSDFNKYKTGVALPVQNKYPTFRDHKK